MPVISINKAAYLIVLSVFILTSCARDVADVDAVEANAPGSSRLSELLRDDGESGFPKAITVREFDFPADHGSHQEYRNEWWYFTGNLDAESGERFGYELTLFRFSLQPEAPDAASSAWATNQVFIGHLAVTDVAAGNFHVAQRYSRGSVGLAGADIAPFRVWLDDWRISRKDNVAGESEAWLISARDREIAVELSLAPEKPVVLNGDAGLSQKSGETGNASYYYSMPRLRTEGHIVVAGQEYVVGGLSWLDREWGSSALSREQQGWDWFALQLSDGSDLMFYILRGADGNPDRFSAGTWTNADGSAEHLTHDEVSIEATDFWESPAGGRYPAEWVVRIPARSLMVKVTPVLANQELVTTVRYWEGAVDIEGEINGREIDGRGYVELTGYADN